MTAFLQAIILSLHFRAKYLLLQKFLLLNGLEWFAKDLLRLAKMCAYMHEDPRKENWQERYYLNIYL